MGVLVATDVRFARHDPGAGHPERSERLTAVLRGLDDAGIDRDCDGLTPRAATRNEMERVHPAEYLDHLERLCAAGGGRLDADTAASSASWEAATHAAGAGLAAIDALDGGDADAAFLAVRPPGHHAVPAHAMGFCLVNNIAVSAASLVAKGERVVIVDWDAHHGNGTQDIFWDEPNVLYVSLHQWPLYPGTGAMDQTGGQHAPRTTLNIPLPAGATGDVYLAALDDVVAPVVDAFGAGWVLVSAGFDAHRDDPLTDLGLSAGDFVDLTARVLDFAPRTGRCVMFLEGGYDLGALRDSVAATVTTMLGAPSRPAPPTSGGRGGNVVDRVRSIWGS
jgi:acetoin utilization deacetylase AcuC-like enzyme